MINFNGRAQLALADEIDAALAELLPGVDAASFNAVIKVETGGPGFDKAGRPQALFERHIFYRDLAGDERDSAVKAGLAYPVWHTRPYPNSSNGIYAEIAAACAINQDAALRSTSWGAGQIMGSEFAEAGYTSPVEMVTAFCDSEIAQIRGMMKLIKARHLDVALEHREWAAFALRYNGSGYKANHYDTKLAAAFASYGKTGGPNVFAIQRALARLHLYEGAIDGAAGPVTKGALIKFQIAHGLADTSGDINDRTTVDALLRAASAVESAAAPLPLPIQPPPPPSLPPIKVSSFPSGDQTIKPPPPDRPPPHDAAGKVGLGALLLGAMAYFKSDMGAGDGLLLVAAVAVVAVGAVYLLHSARRHLP